MGGEGEGLASCCRLTMGKGPAAVTTRSSVTARVCKTAVTVGVWRACVRACMCALICACACVCVCVCVRACVHVCMLVCVHACVCI